jgi:NDP-sugar pyrophosphorylase family protein
MKAMILAAGLGTRLRPLTHSSPKALLQVEGKPLLQHALEHVACNGIRDVIINLHHFPGMIREFLTLHGNFGLNISFSEETAELLDTGGGVKKASWFFNDGKPFLVRNVDVISTLDIVRMLQFHLESGALATLAIRKRESSRRFLFDNRMHLCGWEHLGREEKKLVRDKDSLESFAFNGIQILDPAIFPLITETGKVSLTELYLRLAAVHPVVGYPDEGNQWFSASSPESFS